MQPTSEQLERDPVLLADIIRPVSGSDEGYRDATVSKIERNATGSIVAITLTRPYMHTSEIEYSASPRELGSNNTATSAIVYTGLETWRIELSALTDDRRFYRVVYRRSKPLA